ncbi:MULTISPECIES: hypothetical protein [unclassified Paracoccus (in: a-proteobacteria)]|uniref:hypothetical protein n=1 Tax=unclassified Paracoccus (in: a-proteobacteria) TaxID=2688777 RepID=UPI001C09CCD7|nr:hypothetical protein [Paracoccus sp. C2R09]MBU2958968.1 hypothetical protein [Paracoccus sp. C2R09]
MPGDETFCFKRFPELPFLSAGRLKANDRISIAGKIHDGRVTLWSIRQSALEPIWQAMKVQPVPGDVYADNATM